MISMTIPEEKIRDVIGTGGKVIQKIVADTGAKIDIEDDGSVFISSVDRDNAIKAQEIIKGIIFEPEVGAVYSRSGNKNYSDWSVCRNCTGQRGPRSHFKVGKPPC